MQIKYLYILVGLFLSGLLMGIGFPYSFGISPLIFIGLIPIILFVTYSSSSFSVSWIKKALGIYLFFIAFNITTTWWIKNASMEGAIMAFFLNALLMTIPFMFFNFLYKILGETKALIGLVASWISFEHLHHFWDLSWPWLSFGNALGNKPWLIQWYEYSGIEGGTLWILLVNIICYILIRNIIVRKEKVKYQTPIISIGIAVIIIPISSSVYIYNTYQTKHDPINAIIVQPNLFPLNENFTKAGPKFTTPISQQFDMMLSLVDEKIDDSTDFILFPETAISGLINEKVLDNKNVIFRLRNFSKNNNNIPIYIGADTYGLFDTLRPFPAQERNGRWFENYNTALLIDSRNPIDIYHKAKLVLGAEKMPFVNIFPFIGELAVDLGGTNSMLVGSPKPKLFNPKGIKTAPLICYESVYGEYVSEFSKLGAEILCVMTNDGWWGDTPGYKQHLMFSQIRAIENRRPVLRSANTGISCFINQKGDITEFLDWNERGAIKNSVNKNNQSTFYMIYGDLIGRIALFLFIGIFLMTISNFIRSRK